MSEIIERVVTPQQFHQLGVLVEDFSGSTRDPAPGNVTKADAINMATRQLFTRFKSSQVAANFSFAMITYDHRAKVQFGPTPASSIDDNADYNRLAEHGQGTRIDLALEQASKIANEFLENAPDEGVPHSAVILIMSDGLCSEPVRTRQIAREIKNSSHSSRIQICAALFASAGSPDPAGEALMRDIASDPVMGFKTVYDAETLRNFFMASMCRSSGIQLL